MLSVGEVVFFLAGLLQYLAKYMSLLVQKEASVVGQLKKTRFFMLPSLS